MPRSVKKTDTFYFTLEWRRLWMFLRLSLKRRKEHLSLSYDPPPPPPPPLSPTSCFFPLWIMADKTDRSGCGLFDRQSKKQRQWFVATGQQYCCNLSSCKALVSDGGIGAGACAYGHNSHYMRSDRDFWVDCALFILYLIGQVKLKFTVCRLTSNRIPLFGCRGVCFWSILAFAAL